MQGLSAGTLANYGYTVEKSVDFLASDLSLVRPWSSVEQFHQIQDYIKID
jgi:hypothetical protein